MIEGLQFHHLGVACLDIAAELRIYEHLGYQQEDPIFEDPLQKVRGCFIVGGGPRLELLMPTDPLSPLYPWLRKGIKYYHQAYETPSLEASIKSLKLVRGILVTPPVPAVAFGGREIAFVMLPGMLLIELITAQITEELQNVV
jgi:methylmalonyl-CoA/ethylmalonyl-CoA epimerase